MYMGIQLINSRLGLAQHSMVTVWKRARRLGGNFERVVAMHLRHIYLCKRLTTS